jgi:hypothetical protein
MTACADEMETIALDVPEIGGQEVAGEWLIPRDELLIVSFGAYTVADDEGKAVVKERLAIIGADEVSGATASPLRANRAVLPPPGAYLAVPVPGAPAAPVAKVAVPMPVPAVPSRTMPQGVHADGTPAELPPLPPDEPDAANSDSSEPRASPQTKKAPQTKPSTDPDATKASLPPAPAAVGLPIPAIFAPNPSVGLQFLVPIRPLSFKLPFNQRLEIEIFGRVVAEPGSR